MQTVSAQIRVPSTYNVDDLFVDNIINVDDLPNVLKYISFRNVDNSMIYDENISGYREVTYNKKSKSLYGLTLDNKFHGNCLSNFPLVTAFIEYGISDQENIKAVVEEQFLPECKTPTVKAPATESTYSELSDDSFEHVNNDMEIDSGCKQSPYCNSKTQVKPIPFPNLDHLKVDPPKPASTESIIVKEKEAKEFGLITACKNVFRLPILRYVSGYDLEYIINSSWLLDVSPYGKCVMGKFCYPVTRDHEFKENYYEELIPLTPEEQKEVTDMKFTYYYDTFRSKKEVKSSSSDEIYPVIGKFYPVPGTWYELVHYMIDRTLICIRTFKIGPHRYAYYKVDLDIAKLMIEGDKEYNCEKLTMLSDHEKNILRTSTFSANINILKPSDGYIHFDEKVLGRKIICTDKLEASDIFYMYSLVLNYEPIKVISDEKFKLLYFVDKIEKGSIYCGKMSHSYKKDINTTYCFLNN